MKENKRVVVRSVRMTQEAYDYVQKMEGKNFNDKFNQMVKFCMTREKILYDQINELEKKRAELADKILIEEHYLEYIYKVKCLSEEMFQCIKGE